MLSKEQQDIFYKKLGDNIKATRGDKFVQDELANRTGLSRISIVNIEQGKQKVQLHTLVEIAALLKVQLSEIIPPLDDLKVIDSKVEKIIQKEVEQFQDVENVGSILRDFLKLSQSK
ncbi:MAG: helix-turn-helix transcriptional regulator [Bacteroidia bacterium]|nr:helix-turn-helix transcriptional regulator [Bacteroidia bacterium]